MRCLFIPSGFSNARIPHFVQEVNNGIVLLDADTIEMSSHSLVRSSLLWRRNVLVAPSWEIAGRRKTATKPSSDTRKRRQSVCRVDVHGGTRAGRHDRRSTTEAGRE